MPDVFAALLQRLDLVSVSRPVGRVISITDTMIETQGLERSSRLGDMVRVGDALGQIVAMAPDRQKIFMESGPSGLCLGKAVTPFGKMRLWPHKSWIGRIIDPLGCPLDGGPLFPGKRAVPFQASPPPAGTRRRLGERLETGTIVFDTFLPLVRGQRIGLFAGSGVGKSRLLGQFARNLEADVVVVALVGERGREVREFSDVVLGPEGMARSVIVAATADQSPLRRRMCAQSAMAIAEYFRDEGLQVLFLADSVTRFAEAHREIAVAAGESSQLRGYPPSLQHLIMTLAERAGPGAGTQGDITAVFSVLVAGSDMEEPLADILRGVLDGHAVLDRKIAERGRFPALDLLRSVSRSLPDAASAEENRLLAEAREVLGVWEKAELMVQTGLYQKGTDPAIDRAIRLWPALDSLIAAPSPDGIAGSFRSLRACLAGSTGAK